MKIRIGLILVFIGISFPMLLSAQGYSQPTSDSSRWLFLDTADIPAVKHHLNHEAVFKKYVGG